MSAFIYKVLDSFQEWVAVYTTTSEDGLVIIGRKSELLKRLAWSACALGIAIVTFPVWLIGIIWGRVPKNG